MAQGDLQKESGTDCGWHQPGYEASREISIHTGDQHQLGKAPGKQLDRKGPGGPGKLRRSQQGALATKVANGTLFANISTFKNICVFKKEYKDEWKPRSFKFINLIIYLQTVFPWQSGLDLVSVLGRGSL